MATWSRCACWLHFKSISDTENSWKKCGRGPLIEMQLFSAALRFTAQCYEGFAVICLIVHLVPADTHVTVYLAAIGDYPQPVVHARFYSVRGGHSPPAGRETTWKEENVKNNQKQEKTLVRHGCTLHAFPILLSIFTFLQEHCTMASRWEQTSKPRKVWWAPCDRNIIIGSWQR